MITIGILAPKNHLQISKLLSDTLSLNKSLQAIISNNQKTQNKLDFFKKSGIEYSIVIFKATKIYPVKLDILILDNAENKKIVTPELIKCINNNTILIYNTDNGYLPNLEHPQAIDYGISPDSSVSVSSVNYHEQTTEFLIYIKREICGIFKNTIKIGELKINTKNDTQIDNLLPAVICALLCDVVNKSVFNI